MTTFGFAKGYRYQGDGTLLVKVRIPSVHGPYTMQNYQGQTVRNYIRDEDLPWYQSLLLPHLPNEGEVVAVQSLDEGKSNWIVLGLTGGSYLAGITNQGG